MRVFVFGDSITQGYWGTDGGWVNCIRKHYDELQFQDLRGRDEPSIFNLGISADTSADVLARIEFETKVRTRPTHQQLPVVIVQIGANDSCVASGQVQVPLEAYENNLTAIIEQMKPLSSQLIFVGSSCCDESQTTPVFWGDYVYTNQSIQAYETKMRQVAAAHNIPFIPVFDAFMSKFKQDNSILPDGLHPDNKGHQIIADIVLPQLEELLA